MIDPKFYTGNNPNSWDYDPNIPIGWNKWDAADNYDERDEDFEPLEEEDNEIDNDAD